MPISEKALAGLRAAVEYHPQGGNFMLGALLDFPQFMVYKDDLFGPIELIINLPLPDQDLLPIKKNRTDKNRIPKETVELFKQFGIEWRAKKISKNELRDALRLILDDIGFQYHGKEIKPDG